MAVQKLLTYKFTLLPSVTILHISSVSLIPITDFNDCSSMNRSCDQQWCLGTHL
uniref:Uncharacterized protein n=1 Tax=Heterorhabditis bacteriophora TaxID=37862 RepID=A0A1I7W682_HETBA